jgi:hypothetical protein
MAKHTHPSADLLSLSANLAECDALFAACPDEGNERAASLYERHWSLRERIDRLPAQNLKELKAKAAAATLALKWDPDASNVGEGSFVDMCESINRDIVALAET